MPRFILRYKNAGTPPAGQVAWIRQHFQVLDESPRMLLVEGDAQVAESAAQLPDWQVSPEVQYKIPEKRLGVKKRSV